MLSLADATQLESLGEKGVNRFRPWWEVLTFYSLNGLLMAVLFALAGVTISGTYEISCFPLGNNTALDYNTINYANARCSRIFEGRYLIYFPYGMFLEWAVFFVIHLLWFKLPATFFLFQQLSEIFSDFSSIHPVEFNTEKRKKKGIAGQSTKLTGLQLKENKDTKQKIQNLVNHLMEVLQQNNHLQFLYLIKAICLLSGSAVVMLSLSSWLSARQWHASFSCDMTLHIPTFYKDMTCSLPAAPFLYGLMICNIAFAFSICLCNVRAIIWHCWEFKKSYNDYKKAFKKFKFLEKLPPGFSDFCFCLCLTKFTSKDGMILGDIIYSSMKVYQKSEEYSHVESVTKSRFSSKFYQGGVIAQNLGLKVLELKISDDNFFNAMAMMIGENKRAVCQIIAQELIKNISVYKDLVDNDMNCPVFEECVELIQNEMKSPKEFQHYALMAACKAFNINIVVLRASFKCWYYKTENSATIPTKYLLFIPPSYYAATEDDPALQEKQDNRQRLISDPSFRNLLETEASAQWQKDGLIKYTTTVASLKPTFILYGEKDSPKAHQPTNVLSDLFNEMGQKISKQILNKVYIPGRQPKDQDPVEI